MSNNRKVPSIIEQHPEVSDWQAEYNKTARAATDPIATLDKVEEWVTSSLGAGHRDSWPSRFHDWTGEKMGMPH